MNTLTGLLKNKKMWLGLLVGLVIAFAFGRFLKPAKALAGKLPGL